jgi:RimJ/RimL family protein N-acetyltransferase
MEASISLTPVTEHDFEILYRLTSDPAFTGPHEWYGWQDPGAYRRRWAENGLLGEDGGILMVVEGVIRLGFVAWRKHQTARTSYCWTIGIALEPSARRLGHGTDAQRQLIRYLFAHTQVNRIEAGTEVTNIAEQRALEKAGFTREGVLRGIAFQNGRWHDGVLYSILRTEATPENP